MSNEKSNLEDSSIYNYSDQKKPIKRISNVPKALAITASIVIILAGVKIASGLVGPMLLALFFAIILLVPLRWLQTRGCPKLLAYPIVMLCTIALFVGVTYYVGQSLNVFIGQIPAYRDRFVEKYADLEAQIEEYIERFGFVIGEQEEETVEEPVPDGPAEPATPPLAPAPETIDREQTSDREHGTDWEESPESEEERILGDILSVPIGEVIDWVTEMEQKDPLPIALDPSVVAFWLARIMLYLQGMLGGGFLVLLFTIFMLFEASHFPNKVKRAFGTDGPINVEHFHRIADDVRRYLVLKTVSNLMSASAAMAVYWMFGVEGVLFWGIVAFFMYYIPNIGGTLAAIIPGVLIFMTHDISGVLLYIVCLLTVECAIAYGIEPKLLGHGLRLSTMVIILSLFFWGFILGPIGLFLAAPLTVMIKIILQAFPETRWIAIFLDGGRGEQY